MQNNGWIKLHRQILKWEWWDEPNTFRLFMYLLLSANHEKRTWRGIEIKEGQLLTGRKKLAEFTGLSEQNIRTSLDRLVLTNEITIQTTNRFSVISIVNWSKYQFLDTSLTNETPVKQQTTNQQLTTNKNEKKEKKERIEDIATAKPVAKQSENIVAVIEKFHSTELNTNLNYGNKAQRKSAEELVDKYGLEPVLKLIEFLGSEKTLLDPYAPRVTTPYQLQQKWGLVRQYVLKMKGQQIKNQLIVID